MKRWMSPKTRLPVVMIKWVDTTSYGGWRDRETTDFSLTGCISVGILIARDAKTITIARSISMDDDVNAVEVIPISTVVSIKRLTRLNLA